MVSPLQVFPTATTATTKSPSSSSSSALSSMKIKTLIHTFIISRVSRIVRAISKAKAIIIQIIKDNQPINFIYPTKAKKRKHRQRKIFFGSFRLHYNWCSSSHVLPVPEPVLDGFSSTPHLYYDSTRNSIITSEENNESSELSGYLQWLEENKVNQENCTGNNNSNNSGSNEGDTVMNEIDRLADLFIASCHEKFRLEKQESYRRFQEMMARSM